MNVKAEYRGSGGLREPVGGLIACHECDLLHRIQPIPEGARALCTRCGAFLHRNIRNSLNRALALNLSALTLFVMANIFPFISLKASGRIEENLFVSGGLALYRLGMGELGLLVFLTSFLFPLLRITGMIYILFPLHFGHRPWKMNIVYRMVRTLQPWSLASVFMLGVLISIVKLLDLASVIPGISLYAFAAMIPILAAAQTQMNPALIWPPTQPANNGLEAGGTATERHLTGCHMCGLLVPQTEPEQRSRNRCPRCATPLHARKPNSINRTWALVLTAAMLYIPANIYPVLTVIRFGRGHPNTILSGVVNLIEEGMWGLGMIIFFASIVVPVLKMIVLSFLMVTVQHKSRWRPRDRALLFRVTESVGAWSMVDIYVVAVLVGLVNFGVLTTIRPGIGATFFAAVVVVTLLAARSFDPRLIWDNSERPSR